MYGRVAVDEGGETGWEIREFYSRFVSSWHIVRLRGAPRRTHSCVGQEWCGGKFAESRFN